jgi:DNA-binding XRE family transcriptional regulator
LITSQFRSQIDKLNDVIFSRIEKETSKLSEAVASLRKGTQQQIQNVNERVDAVTKGMNEKIVAVSECVNVKLKEQLAENKLTQTKLSKDIEVNTKEMIAKELSAFRNSVAEDNETNVQERVKLLTEVASQK